MRFAKNRTEGQQISRVCDLNSYTEYDIVVQNKRHVYIHLTLVSFPCNWNTNRWRIVRKS